MGKILHTMAKGGNIWQRVKTLYLVRVSGENTTYYGKGREHMAEGGNSIPGEGQWGKYYILWQRGGRTHGEEVDKNKRKKERKKKKTSSKDNNADPEYQVTCILHKTCKPMQWQSWLGFIDQLIYLHALKCPTKCLSLHQAYIH